MMEPAMGAPTDPSTAGSAFCAATGSTLPPAFCFTGTSTIRGTPFTSAVKKESRESGVSTKHARMHAHTHTHAQFVLKDLLSG